MNNATQSKAFVGRMEALADTTRLRLLRLLDAHELGVAELCEVLQLPQSTVSRHLKLLAEQGFLGSRRQGTSNLYRVEAGDLDPTTRKLYEVARQETALWPSAGQDDLRLARHLEVKRSDARSFFAGAAARWDSMRAELYGERFATAAMLGLLPHHWTVADLGCGAGHLTAQIAPYVRRVIGVDDSPAMLSAAKRRTGGIENAEVREGRLESVPIESSSCDAALLVLTLTYVADPPAVLKELVRLLRPGGRGTIVDLLAHEREDFRREMGQQCLGFAPHEIEQMLNRAGLGQVLVRPLPPEPQAKGPALFLAVAEKPLHNGT